MNSPKIFIVLLGVLIILSGAVIFIVIARRYRRELGMRTEQREKTSDTSFIINAFQEITKQLKESEKELVQLKALAEQRAENVENYNENILRCVSSGVMTFDKDCLLTTINRAGEEMLAMHREQSVGRLCKDLFGDNDMSRAVQDTLDNKRTSARMETLLERPGGRIWLGFNTALLKGREGSALGVILSFSDLTEVKRLQEQVELRERLTALGEMSAGIAHELRNPMAVIAGYLNLLSRKADTGGQEIIGRVSSEINGMNRIIDDLLTFARPAALNRVSLDLKELIENCLAIVLQTGSAGSHVKTELRLDTLEAALDEVLMRQALSNLIRNAVESMPIGGTLSLSASAVNNEVTIKVGDTGEGISPDLIKNIFLPFFTTKDKGVGMGLALVHKVITSHGGRVEVESTVGKGTVFTIFLPKG